MPDKVNYYDLGLSGDEIVSRLNMAKQDDEIAQNMKNELDTYVNLLAKCVFGEDNP